MIRQGQQGASLQHHGEGQRLPAGSELMLASVLGVMGWWVIGLAVRWLAG